MMQNRKTKNLVVIFGFSSSLLPLIILLLISSYPSEVSSHGRLIEPPSRSSMWRYGFNTTANYNDHELYCGGFARQHQKNRGKCGVCGDPYDGPKPNEAGGLYAAGIMVRKYRKNSIIRVKVELTANHKGYFEFRLCPNNNPKRVVLQKCLDNYVLQQSNSEGPRYYPSEGTKVFESRYLLPKGLTCTQCVLQWRYIAANSWGGPCPDGSPEGIGCGPQEEFRACSDVAIYDDTGYASAEQPEFSENEDNDDDNKVIATPTTNSSTPRSPPTFSETQSLQMWPFILAFILLLLTTTGLSYVLWFFYKAQIIAFLRETRSKFADFKGGRGGRGSTLENSRNTTTYDPNHPPHGGQPVPPPRMKKLHSPNNNRIMNSNNHTHHPPDIYGQPHKHRVGGVITPDVISHPLQVTINGLPV